MALPQIQEEAVTRITDSQKDNRQRLQKSLRAGQLNIVKAIENLTGVIMAESERAREQARRDAQRRALADAALQKPAAPAAVKGPKAIGAKEGALGLLGGLLGGIGGLAGGAGLVALAGGVAAMAGALALMANPITMTGAAVLGGLVAVGTGALWLISQSTATIVKSIDDLSGALIKLNDAGSKIKTGNLENAGKGMSAFLKNASSWGSFTGAIITSIADIQGLGKNLTALNNANISTSNMENAGKGLGVFITSLSNNVSLFDTIKTSLAGAFTSEGSITTLVNSIASLDKTSKEVDTTKMDAMSKSLGALNGALTPFAKTGFLANFIGEKAISDVAKGITSLNKAESGNLATLSTNLKAIDAPAFEWIKTAFAANFVGVKGIPDVAKGITELNKAESWNLPTLADGLNKMDAPMFAWIKTAFVGDLLKLDTTTMTNVATGITELNKAESTHLPTLATNLKLMSPQMFTWILTTKFADFLSTSKDGIVNMADGITALNNAAIGSERLPTLATGLDAMAGPLTKLTGIKALANFAGGSGIKNIAESTGTLIDKLGAEDAPTKALRVKDSLDRMQKALLSFTGTEFISSITGGFSKLTGALFGEKSPLEFIAGLTDKSKELSVVSTSMMQIANAMKTMSKLEFDDTFENLANFADKATGLAPKIGEITEALAPIMVGGDTNVGGSPSTTTIINNYYNTPEPRVALPPTGQ